MADNSPSRKAAEVFAEATRRYALKYGLNRVADSVHVEDSGAGATVVSGGAEAPMAQAFNTPKRHPLNYPNQRNAQHGAKRPMARTPNRPYAKKAAADPQVIANAAGAALDETVRKHWDTKEF